MHGPRSRPSCSITTAAGRMPWSVAGIASAPPHHRRRAPGARTYTGTRRASGGGCPGARPAASPTTVRGARTRWQRHWPTQWACVTCCRPATPPARSMSAWSCLAAARRARWRSFATSSRCTGPLFLPMRRTFFGGPARGWAQPAVQHGTGGMARGAVQHVGRGWHGTHAYRLPGSSLYDEAPILMAFSALLKLSPLRHALDEAVAGLDVDTRVALRTADAAAVHTVLTETVLKSRGCDLSRWTSNVNLGSVSRIHGVAFLERMGVVRAATWEADHQTAVIDGKRWIVQPLTVSWEHVWAGLGPLQCIIGVYLRHPCGSQCRPVHTKGESAREEGSLESVATSERRKHVQGAMECESEGAGSGWVCLYDGSPMICPGLGSATTGTLPPTSCPWRSCVRACTRNRMPMAAVGWRAVCSGRCLTFWPALTDAHLACRSFWGMALGRFWSRRVLSPLCC